MWGGHDAKQVHVYTCIKINMVRYRYKILKTHGNALQKKVYQLIQTDADNNVTYEAQTGPF